MPLFPPADTLGQAGATYYMGAPSGGDDTAAFQAARAALPTLTIYATPPSGGSSATFHYGTIYLGSGTYQIGASADIGNLGPFVSVIGPGHLACTLDYYGSGSCIQMHSTIKPTDDTFDDLAAFAGKLDGFTIDGTNAGSTAKLLDYGDFEGGVLGPDLWVQNATGASAWGVYFNNQVSWTESIYGRVVVRNCTNLVGFDVTGGDTSFEYNDLTFKLYVWPGQNGVSLNHGANYSNGSLKVRANCLAGVSSNGGALFWFGTSTSPNNRIAYSRLDVQAEINGAGSFFHQTFNFTTAYYSLSNCTGTMIFGDSGWVVSNYNQQYPLVFDGVISGDSVLAGATNFNPATMPMNYAGISLSSLGIKIAAAHPLGTSSSGNLSNEVLYWMRATAQQAGQITIMGCNCGTAGITPGAGANRMAVYTLASATATTASLAQQTADMTTAFETAGWVEGTLAAGVDLQAGQDYILAVLTSFTGTVPNLTRWGLSANGNPFNGIYLMGFLSSQATMPGTLNLSGSTVLGSPYSVYGR